MNQNKGMAVLLLQPKVGKFDYAGLRLPDGLLSIAAQPAKRGYKVKIIDQRLDNKWKETTRNFLKNNHVLCAGITCMTGPQIRYALDASRFVKSVSNVPVVWGGVHPTFFYTQCLKEPEIDYVVIGEGEDTFMEFIQKLEKRGNLGGVKGLAHKVNGKIIVNPPREIIKDMNRLPHLPYDLIDVHRYRASGLFKGPSITFFSSRGCPWPCAFCYNAKFNKGRWRGFSADNTVDRLEAIVNKYGIRQFFIQDDNFIVDVKRFKEMMHEIIKRKLAIKWACLGVRIDTVEKIGEEGLDLMVNAGCLDIDIGVESGSERVLKMIRKGISIDQVLRVNKMLAKFSINTKYTFIIGFPAESEEEVQKTLNLAIRLVEENEKVFTLIFVYTPYPGTELFDKAVRAGFQIPERLEEWGEFTRDEWFMQTKNWLSEQQRKRYNSICFTSMFACKAGKTKLSNSWSRFLFDLYHPIAKFRLRHNFHRFQIESYVQKKILGLIMRQ